MEFVHACAIMCVHIVYVYLTMPWDYVCSVIEESCTDSWLCQSQRVWWGKAYYNICRK